MLNNYLSFETIESTETVERVKSQLNLNVQMSQKLINMRIWTTDTQTKFHLFFDLFNS